MQRFHRVGPRARGCPVGVAWTGRAASRLAAALGVLTVFEAGKTIHWTGHAEKVDGSPMSAECDFGHVSETGPAQGRNRGIAAPRVVGRLTAMGCVYPSEGRTTHAGRHFHHHQRG